MDWLVQALKYSDASFKLVAVGSQVLNSGAVFETYATMPEERAELLRRIEQEGISGVVFVTGDRHFSELSEMTLDNGIHVWDLTSSPLTSGTGGPKLENTYRVPGTLVQQHSFATISFAGPKGVRVMTMRAHDAEGKVLWERAIDQQKRP
jgi:alkaline phosphatase D